MMKRAFAKRHGWVNLLQETRLPSTESRTFSTVSRQKLSRVNHHGNISRRCTNCLRVKAVSSARSLSSGPVNSLAEFSSPLPDVDIPDVSFAEFMFRRYDEFKDNVAASDYLTGRQYTYAQLKDLTTRVASALHRRGFGKGDVIATFTINLPEFSILVVAAACLGAVVSPANPQYTPAELGHMLAHNGARAVFTIPQLVPVVQSAIADPDLSHNVKEVYTFVQSVEEGTQSFKDLMDDDGKAFPENVDIDSAKDVFLMPYSSGTTGLPKGVMLSHRNILANILQFRGSTKTRPEDRTLGLLPFFHIYGLTAVQFGTLYDGAELVTVPKFDPEMFLKVIQDKKISLLQAVPPVVLFLARHPLVSKFDLSSVRYMNSGAAPLGEALTLECQNRLGFPIYQGYGLTETSPVIHIDSDPGYPGTIGTLVPNTKAKLISVETGNPVGIGELGEYCMDGPQKMLGYLHNQEATDDMIDTEGWLHTGDLGYLREDGMIVIEDRLKELIKYKGFQVPPAELEGLLLSHPAVQDAGVIGVPDPEAGELPRAYVVLKPRVTASPQDIAKFVEGKVNPSKKLRGGVEVVEEIPKSQSGKILRRVLKERALQAA